MVARAPWAEGGACSADGRCFCVSASVSVLCELKSAEVTNVHVHAHPRCAQAAPAVICSPGPTTDVVNGYTDRTTTQTHLRPTSPLCTDGCICACEHRNAASWHRAACARSLRRRSCQLQTRTCDAHGTCCEHANRAAHRCLAAPEAAWTSRIISTRLRRSACNNIVRTASGSFSRPHASVTCEAKRTTQCTTLLRYPVGCMHVVG